MVRAGAKRAGGTLVIGRSLQNIARFSWFQRMLLPLVVYGKELDERLSRQLLRLQSQTDRVMEVFVTSLVALSQTELRVPTVDISEVRHGVSMTMLRTQGL